MSEIFKMILSLSLSGSLLIIIIAMCCRLFGKRLSKRWQYYIWIVAVLRLMIPFSTESSFIGMMFEEHRSVSTSSEAQPAPAYNNNVTGPVSQTGRQDGDISPGAARQSPLAGGAARILNALPDYIWAIWLLVAIVLLIRKITLYQSFAKYIKAGKTEVSDPAILNLLGDFGEQIRVKRPVELYINGLIASPIIIGFFRPRIVLPSMPVDAMEFKYICLHELIHYKRGDIFYKWLLQIVLCLHWFNPLVYLMVWEANRACELSCDEALIRTLNTEERGLYGDTLLGAIKNHGEYREGIAALTLSENASRLKERLEAIKIFNKATKGMVIVALVLSVSMFAGGFLLGAYYPASLSATPVTNDSFPITQILMENSLTMDKIDIIFLSYQPDNQRVGRAMIDNTERIQEFWYELSKLRVTTVGADQAQISDEQRIDIEIQFASPDQSANVSWFGPIYIGAHGPFVFAQGYSEQDLIDIVSKCFSNTPQN